jgi:hypothetical protein
MMLLLVLHAAATLAMTGLIWFVQLVHYPLFACVDRRGFVEFERLHQARTTWVVAPLMLTELATALALVRTPPAADWAPWTWTGLGLVGFLWLTTALVQVPLHRRLDRGWDAEAHRALVRSNWLRTAAWTVRGVLALALLTAVPLTVG